MADNQSPASLVLNMIALGAKQIKKMVVSVKWPVLSALRLAVQAKQTKINNKK